MESTKNYLAENYSPTNSIVFSENGHRRSKDDFSSWRPLEEADKVKRKEEEEEKRNLNEEEEDERIKSQQKKAKKKRKKEKKKRKRRRRRSNIEEEAAAAVRDKEEEEEEEGKEDGEQFRRGWNTLFLFSLIKDCVEVQI